MKRSSNSNNGKGKSKVLQYTLFFTVFFYADNNTK